METALTILVAKIAAVGYLAAGVGALNGSLSIKKMISDFQKNEGLRLMTGFTTLIIGMLLIENHNIWAWEWPVLVTIIGWGAAIKGVGYIAFPKQLFSLAPLFKSEKGTAILMLVIGLVFGYYGFLV